MQTIYFEDQGQDFLEWDIDGDGVVVGWPTFPGRHLVWRGGEEHL